MIEVCALSDYNYLAKGLTLYDSLIRHTPKIRMHYLCLDDKSFEVMSKIQKETPDTLKVYKDDLLEDPERRETLNNLKADEHKYYCWALASYFTDYLMRNSIGDITYIDSDIYFYDDLNILIDEIGDKEVGIFRHRQYPLNIDNPNGRFNVGVVHFKSKRMGQSALSWWADAVLNKKYPHLATCGDQKYLDAFLQIPKEKLFIEGNIGHGAPWQWQMFDYTDFFKDHSIIWEDKKQKLLFSHFSEFSYNISEDSYVCSTRHHCFTPLQMYEEIDALKTIHADYYKEIKHVVQKYNLEV